MRPLRQGDGWVNFCPESSEFPSPLCPSVTVQPPVVDALKAQLAGLSENLSQIAGTLKLQ
jgi:iron uptake system component EfeO